MTSSSRGLQTLLLTVAVGLLGAVSARAQDQERDEYGEVTQTVARVAQIDGAASYARGDDPDNWQAADRNVPMTVGDRIYSDEKSRVELEVHGGAYVRVGAHTDLATLNLTDDTKQFALKAGVASFHVRRLADDEVFEVDTPNAAITFQRPGNYRIDVDGDGNTRFAVRGGAAEVSAGGGTVSVSEGELMTIDGDSDAPRYDVVPISAPDGWDRWVGDRESRVTKSSSYQYVDDRIVGAEELDQFGRWEDVPGYGHCWTPASVTAGWVPYRIGHWVWQDPWGWSWVSGEPWGWAPYHYGRWVSSSSRWYWVPVAPRTAVVAYSPALVAFVGGGPGFSTSVSVGGDFVGWFPLGPRDPFAPWWGRQRTDVNVNVTNVTYVNRTYVTVVKRDTFVAGGVVTNGFVRDARVIRDINAAPVVRGPLAVVPTRESLRGAVRTGLASQRPPAAMMARSVVVRNAPPPAPPTFQQKLTVIQQNQGRPVGSAAAAQMSIAQRSRPQAIAAVKPVAAASGRVTLAPRTGASAQAPKPQPVVASRGRTMATADQPVASSPVPARGAAQTAPARQVDTRERVLPPTPRPAPSTESRETEPRNVATPRPAAATDRQLERERMEPSPPRPQPTAVPQRSLQERPVRPTAGAEERPTPRPEGRRIDREQRRATPVPPRSQPTPEGRRDRSASPSDTRDVQPGGEPKARSDTPRDRSSESSEARERSPEPRAPRTAPTPRRPKPTPQEERTPHPNP